MPPTWAWSRSSASMLWRLSLASKLNPPLARPPPRRDGVQGESALLRAVGELVRVPTQQRIAPIDVEAAEKVVRQGVLDLVLEAVAGQGGVIDFDVELDLPFEPELAQEGVDGRRVEVVLVLGGLHGLGLDQERAREADLVLVLHDELHEATELLDLAAHVGVEQVS